MEGRETGIPWVWVCAGAMVTILVMILALFGIILVNGLAALWPKPVMEVHREGEPAIVGVHYRSITDPKSAGDTEEARSKVLLYKANQDLSSDDFAYVSQVQFQAAKERPELWFLERLEWGPFIGTITQFEGDSLLTEITPEVVTLQIEQGQTRRQTIEDLEKNTLSKINMDLENARIELRRLRRLSLNASQKDMGELETKSKNVEARMVELQNSYQLAAESVSQLKIQDDKFKVTLLGPDGASSKTIPTSQLVRAYRTQDLTLIKKIRIYLSRSAEFIFGRPREANTAGGIWPAIFGTVTMTLLMSVVVMPVGVLTALYMREIAQQGPLVSLVRIAVGNLAGVPSIVYGVFGLGFFCYTLGASIDEIFFLDKLPTATYGTGGILWASLTLALLTVPVVIVSTEEALASVPRTLREASYGCGATRLQTIWNIVLPKAMPGVLTGLILAIARGIGEVAPLLVTGAVKLAPMLPIDGNFPYVHLQRSFMHLSFHIYDLGFQSRSTELTRPLVFATTTLLIGVVLLLNFSAFKIRSTLRKRFEGRGAF
jgi:phosphate transport system permease protein